MYMAITDFLAITAEIKRLSHSENDYGGEDNTWSTHIASYSCRIYQTKGESQVSDIGKTENSTHKAIGANVDILAGDKLVNSSEEYIVKRVYKVYDEDSIHHLELFLERIK